MLDLDDSDVRSPQYSVINSKNHSFYNDV